MRDFFPKISMKVISLLMLYSITAGVAKSQEIKVVSMTKYLSNCLYNFSRNINWPPENKSGDFIIAIVGSKELYNEMTKLTQNMRVGMQPIQMKLYNTVNELDGYQHIVFIDSWQSGKMDLLLKKVTGKSTLIVTETEGLIDRGSMINFIEVNGLMHFEMGKENLKKNNLMASSVLEKMAISAN